MKNKNLTVSIFVSLVLLSVVCIFIIGFSWISDSRTYVLESTQELVDIQYETAQSELKGRILSLVDYIDYQRLQAETLLKDSIKEQTYEAYDIMYSIYNKYVGVKSDEEIQSLIVSTLRNIRFNEGRGYHFIDTMEGDVVLYPIFPSSEGSNLINLQDDLGNYTLKGEIDLVRAQGEGFIEGYWKKPDVSSDDTFKKITYVKAFEPYNWYFGCGEYLEDVENQIKENVLSYFDNLTYGSEDEQYIFVHNFEGVELANGSDLSLIGKNIYNIQDKNGIYVVQEQIKLVSSIHNGGFLKHFWSKDGIDTEKLTYVHRVKDWDWVIGTSLPIAYIDKAIENKQLGLKDASRKQSIKIIAVLMIAIVLSLLIARILVNMIKKNINQVISTVESAADDLKEIALERVTYTDFKDMLHATNKMTYTINNLLYYDEITGLANKKQILSVLDNLHIEAIETGNPLSLIIYDIDHFQNINEIYGEATGDLVLKIVGKMISKCLRESDEVARYEMDRFLVVLPNTTITIAEDIADRIRKIVEQIDIEPLLEPVTLSGGVYSSSTDSVKKMIKGAETVLIKSKKRGRNNICS